MIRNALDHGIEDTDGRRGSGKALLATVGLSAVRDERTVTIELSDDGRGIDASRVLKKAIDKGIVAPDADLSESDVFLLIFALDNQNVAISVAARATGEEIYAASSLIAGALKILFSVMLAKQFGLIGVALGTLIALGLTNHWYVPWRGLTRLTYPRVEFVWNVVLPCIGIGLACALTVAGLTLLFGPIGPWHELVLTLACASVFFLAGMWLLVLEPGQRKSLLGRCGSTYRKSPFTL
jgi:hypothetical protein